MHGVVCVMQLDDGGESEATCVSHSLFDRSRHTGVCRCIRQACLTRAGRGSNNPVCALAMRMICGA